jgi:hypothetical protein
MTIKRIKKIFSWILVLSMLCMPMFVMSPAYAQITLNLKAVWVNPADGDLAGLKFYDTTLGSSQWKSWKGAGVWGSPGAMDAVALPVSPQLLNFAIGVADSPSTGTLKFSMMAFDTNGNNGNTCPDALYVYNTDTTPPGLVTGLTISKQ